MINKLIRNLGKQLQAFLFRYGFEFDLIRPSNSIEKSLSLLLRQRNIDVLLDIGANRGQFLKRIRGLGFEGDVFCVEPLLVEGNILAKTASKYPKTRVLSGSAVSNKRGKAELNVSKNSVSSSLNYINKKHVASAEGSEISETLTVDLVTLSDLLEEFPSKKECAIKLDVQGHENTIIEEMQKSDLRTVKIIQLELSKVHLYEGSSVDKEIIPILEDLGFTLFSLGCGFSDPITGEMLQYDAIYVRD